MTRRLLGAAFLAVLAGFGVLTYAFFTKAFTPSVQVTVETSHIGLQLGRHADVKLRGLIVGEVRDVRSDGHTAWVDVALRPDATTVIPANVSARIVPKTLFGEKYVELVVPDRPARRTIAEGDVIRRERTSVGLEVEAVLEDVYPLLRTLRPEQLNATLTALATALEGRGEDIGASLNRLDGYLTKLEPHLPILTDDVSALADVATVYEEATPDVARLLANATRTGDTVVLKQRVLEDFLVDLASAGAVAREFLAANEDGLIRVGEVSRPTLDLLATYSPEYACLLEGMAKYVPRFEDAFGGGEHFEGSAPALHITLELVNQKRGYTRDDLPAFLDDRGPGCRTLPNPPYSQDNPAPASGVRDGVGEGPGPEARPPIVDVTSGYAGTVEERRVVNSLLAPVLQVAPEDVPDAATLLFGPMARGNEVSLR